MGHPELPSRRDALLSLAGVLLASPAIAKDALRTVGVLFGAAANDPFAARYVASIMAGLARAGWEIGREVGLAVRFSGGDRSAARTHVAELVSTCDVLICGSEANADEAARATRELPIVFAAVGDPIRIGLVESLGRPGRNATGFSSFVPTHGGKWLDLLREINPSLRHVAFVYQPDPRTSAYAYYPLIIEAAERLGIAASTIHIRSEDEIDEAVAAVAAIPEGGIVVGHDSFLFSHRLRFLEAVWRWRLPAIYPFVEFVEEGGLIAYSIDLEADFMGTGLIAGRVLSGDRPAEIPVQNPTRYLLAINLATAAALSLTVPETLLVTADRLVE